MNFQRAAWSGDACKCEVVFLRAQVRELKEKRKHESDEEAVVRCRYSRSVASVMRASGCSCMYWVSIWLAM